MAIRPIDQLRSSAGKMTIGTDAEGGITGLVVIDDKLYTVKKKAVYRVALADEIDPDRTRAEVPNTNQRVLSAGSDSPVVQATLLTAAELFKKDVLAPGLDYSFVLDASLKIAQELVHADAIREAIVGEIRAIDDNALFSTSRSFSLPSIDDLSTRVKSFIQRVAHALQNMLDILHHVFNDFGKPYFDGFAKQAATKYGEEHPFSIFCNNLAELSKIVKGCRNAIEHPKPHQVFITENYSIDKEMVLRKPQIGLIYDPVSFDREDADIFLSTVFEGITSYFETMLAYIANLHVLPVGGLEQVVMAVPEGKRRNGVKFAYHAQFNGKWMRVG